MAEREPKWGAARKAERWYGRALLGIARQVGEIARGMGALGARHVEEQLRKYGEFIKPWAQAVAGRMYEEVARRDLTAWRRLSKKVSRNLQVEVAQAPTGEIAQRLQAEQVALITSLPREAAERVQRLALEAITKGTRPRDLEAEILATGEVTASRARLIARTEVAKASSVLVQARATHLGSEGYIWRTVGDKRVRPLHRKLNGKFIRWDDPPIAGENGERAHAGQIYSCRCVPEPVIPDTL